jgi:regulator of vacuolar morphogenesis
MAVDPQMAQLACMDQESILGVLQIMARLLSEILRGGDAEKIRRIGAWAWGLLGKCREIGELSTEEVGDIRDIGKRAVKILQKIREAEENPQMEGEETPLESEAGEDIQPEILAPEEESEEIMQPEPGNDAVKDADADMADENDQELEAAKARLQAKVQERAEDELASADQESVAKQTRAMLDMIITVAGEFFGQRDLLDSREVWA